MILGLILAAMTLFAGAMLLWPLLRRTPEQMPRAAYDLEIYRDQLGELDRDVARGLVPDDQADAARAEIGRRILAADQALQDGKEHPSTQAPEKMRMIPIAICATAPLLAVMLYLQGGTPQLVDGGRTMKVADTQEGAKAEAGKSAHDISPMIEKLEEHLRKTPDDLKGWTMLARTLYSVSRFGEAASAYANALALAPDRADLMALQAESLSFANDGLITPKARQLFAQATTSDPKNARALYYLALAKLQSGQRREALDDWRALAADAAPDAPWLATLRQRIARIQAELDGDGAAPAAQAARGPTAPGPTAADVTASQSMSPKDRSAMIRSMVQRLADRLKAEPNDADGWRRLGRAYGVLGEQQKSRDALARAAALQPTAKAAPKQSGPGPDAEQIKAAQSMSPDDRRKMIRSMVQRLADQLKNNPDDAEGWLRLGRAHGVLGEHQKSRDAYAQAVKLRPRDINVLTTYAQTLIQTATKGKIPPELAGMAKRILDIDPRNANGLWVAGLTAKEAGNMEAAGRHLRLLLTLLSPKAPERARVQAEIESLTKKE
ncbi:MAG: c-type cytochrome biogenesis protein CcmI [Rhodospirillales bacterium]|nr:c-type cytochrome biogenesis protein CcmI [Rhodospirillales bacterium]